MIKRSTNLWKSSLSSKSSSNFLKDFSSNRRKDFPEKRSRMSQSKPTNLIVPCASTVATRSIILSSTVLARGRVVLHNFSSCNASFHKKCYSIKSIPWGDFFCDVCKKQEKGTSKKFMCRLCNQESSLPLKKFKSNRNKTIEN